MLLTPRSIQSLVTLAPIRRFKWRMMSSSIPIENPKRIVFLGTPDVASRCLNSLWDKRLSNNYDVVAVVTQPPAPSGRSLSTRMSPVHRLANQLSIPVLCPEKANEPEFIQSLSKLNVDLCVTAAYGNYLPRAFLQIPRFGTVNIHPSLLPRYRGAAPVQRCLLAGDTVTGVSVLFSVAKMDAGPILRQTQYPLSGDENAKNLLSTLFDIGTDLLIESLAGIFSGAAVVSQQSDAEATLAPKLNVSDGIIDFLDMSASQIHNNVRALIEWPGSHAVIKFEDLNEPHIRIKLLSTEVISDTSTQKPTNAINIGKHNNKMCLIFPCKNGGSLAVYEILPDNRKAMNAKSFVNGLQGRKMFI